MPKYSYELFRSIKPQVIAVITNIQEVDLYYQTPIDYAMRLAAYATQRNVFRSVITHINLRVRLLGSISKRINLFLIIRNIH